MIAYEGVRTSNGARVFRVEGEERAPLQHRIVYHSPTGFEFGYAGSGPADLALNILADASGWNGYWDFSRPHAEAWCRTHGTDRHEEDDFCWYVNDHATAGDGDLSVDVECSFPSAGMPLWVWRLHQAFKHEVIATADRQGFRISADEVLEWVQARSAHPGPVTLGRPVT